MSGSAIWLGSADGNSARRLTAFQGSIKAFEWAPDGRSIAAIINATIQRSPDAPIDLNTRRGKGHVYIIDVTTGKSELVAIPGDVSVYDLAWFPDSRRLVVRLGDGARYGDQFYASRLEVVNLGGKVLQHIKDDKVSYQHPSVSPNGKDILYAHFVSPHGLASVYTDYDVSRRTSSDIGLHWTGTVEELRWITNSRLVGIGLHGVYTELIDVDRSNGSVSQLVRLSGQAVNMSRSADGHFVYIGNTVEEPNNVWVYNALRHDVHVLTNINPQVSSWALADLRVVRWKSSQDGTMLSGLLAVPRRSADNHGKGPWKALVQAHGGPLFAWQYGWLGSWEAWAQVLVSRGYAVFMPNPRGSMGRGYKFANANFEDWGGSDYRDILDGVSKLVSERVLDPNGLAIGGWSYGGFMSAWAAGHNGEDGVHFKAAIIGAPPVDLFLMVLNSDLGYNFTAAYFGDPFVNRRLYAEHSPIHWTRDVSIPVLLMQGINDHRVPLANGLMFYHALRHYGKDVRMVLYPNGTHWLSSSVGSQDEENVQRSVVGWLERYLGEGDVHATSKIVRVK